MSTSSARRRSLVTSLVTLVLVTACATNGVAKPRAKVRPTKARTPPARAVIAPVSSLPSAISNAPAAPPAEPPSLVTPPPPAMPVDADRGPARADAHTSGAGESLRAGALAGAGFPHPLAIELMVAPTSRSAFGVEGSLAPAITLAPVTLQMWAVAADARVFPFRGAFFVGARAGFQRLTMTAAMNVPTRGAVSVEAIAETAFVNPRVGFLWRTESGLTFGVDAGVSVPVHPTLRAPFPTETPDGARQRVARVADALGNAPTPSVDLLRVGMLF